jgi:hypothetical protein
MNHFKRLGAIMIIVSIWQVVPNLEAFAQNCDLQGAISIDIQLAPILSESQVLGLTALGIDNRGSGPQIFTGIMKNETDEQLNNLYFEFRIEAATIGVIAEIEQQAAYPFSLAPQQLVYGTNNDIDNEKIPGIDDDIRFNGGITVAGEDFIESLGGSTELPNDIYSIYGSVSQVTNECGRVILAEETVTVGGSSTGAVLDELSITLRTPGAEIGSNFSISNPYPQLSWEGDASVEYRVIVVSGDADQDVQTMINDSKEGESTRPLITPYEYLDVSVTGTSLQYPTAGAQALVTGQTYYWQVSTEVASTTGFEEYVSDTWAFTLIDPSDGSAVAAQEIDEETIQALIALIGTEMYTTLSEDGYLFESIELDNQSFSGVVGIQKLAEILSLINDGDIIVNDN